MKTSGTARTVAARGSHTPPPLAAHGSTRRREIKPETGGQKWLSPLFSSLPAVTTTAICRKEKHTQTAVDFNFFLSVTDLLLCRSVLCFLSLLCHGRVCCRGDEGSCSVLWRRGKAALVPNDCGRRTVVGGRSAPMNEASSRAGWKEWRW